MAFLSQYVTSKYDPKDTATFKDHFGAPTVEQLPSPLELFWTDVWGIIKNIRLLPDVLRPFFTTNPDDELYLLPPSGLSIWWWSLFSFLQIPPMLILIALSILTISLLQLLSNLHSLLFWSPIQGPSLQVFPPSPPRNSNPRHRWLFINGIAVPAHGLHQNLRVLSTTFNAPVLGIHNRTYGFLGDLVECVFQRSFAYRTLETRLAVPVLSKYLLAPDAEVEKVVLVAHSQGGICAADVLDQVFATVPWERIHDRLEVYTFGSAAGHFRNPWMDAAGTGSRRRLVRRMEHYCHEDDMVTSFGALSALQKEGNPYKGEVFVWKGKPGHLLNQHYLKDMFNPETVGKKGSFFEGKVVPYKAGEKGDGENGRWYVEPGMEVGEGEKRVKDLSYLWRYMVGKEEEKVDEMMDGKTRDSVKVNGH
ncbi:hypothetical protein B9Z65_3056 [Elsinoe australis]|uniref:DUF676 domain-containing protein n=1 Tax=Elsinoe australis TaxID=40998 RepID=A0A2P7ZUA6_9PEZI|nr:hypothetical protein B9Z65_3056 [Elsinoe australis]